MPNANRNRSRREFLQRGACGATGLALASVGTNVFAQSDSDDRFPLSLHQYSLKKLFDEGELNILNYARFAKEELGITNIEFAVEFCEDLPDNLVQADAIRKQSEDLGVKHRVMLCGAEPALDAAAETERKAALEDHLKWAKVAERLGCQFIRVRASTEGDRQEQLEHAIQGIRALCDSLRSSTVKVLIENIMGFSRDPKWLTQLVERIGKRRVGLIADFGNFDGDIYDGMRQLLPYTKSICTKSWEFDNVGNETKIDYERMLGIIKQSQFRGCIAIEYLGETPVEGVRKTAALVRKLI